MQSDIMKNILKNQEKKIVSPNATPSLILSAILLKILILRVKEILAQYSVQVKICALVSNMKNNVLL